MFLMLCYIGLHMPLPLVPALMGLARVAGSALVRGAAKGAAAVGTQAGRKGLMEGAKKVGVQAKDYAKDKAMEKVTEIGQTNPMDAAMEHMKEKQKQDDAQTHEMMMRTRDKASGDSQSTSSSFGQ